MKQLLNRKTIPLFLLTIMTLITLFQVSFVTQNADGERWRYTLNQSHYLGFAAIFILYSLFIIKSSWYKYALLASLIFALFNLFNFSLTQWSFFFRFGNFTIQFQPIILLIILLTYALNYNKINNELATLFGPSQKNKDEQQRNAKLEVTKRYKAKYEAFESKKLELILKDDRYEQEAREAAQEVLDNRNTGIR